MVTTPVLNVYGVRGSIPAANQRYMRFGGNTSSYTLRTPANSLIFLDAGTGIVEALEELKEHADQVILALSHTHADHIQGLAMPNEGEVSPLPWLSKNEFYEHQKVQLIGPVNTMAALDKYYDACFVWPVTPEWMGSIDFKNRIEAQNNGACTIDDVTTVRTMYGNHPVSTGVVLYRFEMKTMGGLKVVAFATDNEFDYAGVNKINPQAQKLKDAYVEFVAGADLLVADAQYDMLQYLSGTPRDVRGFGHSYHEQILDLAAAAGVKSVLLTHHDRWSDDRLREKDAAIRVYGCENGLEAQLAREGMSIRLHEFTMSQNSAATAGVF